MVFLMIKKTTKVSLFLYWLLISCLVFLCTSPTFATNPIDGFRELKFGMSPQEVQALPNCSTSHECMYELSNKNRYIQLTFSSNGMVEDLNSTENLQLAKATIDMGQYAEDWYKQLQTILGKSYRLSHDFTDDTMNAFLAGQFKELHAGYEDGQVVLTVARRQFGNLVLRVIYQNSSFASQFLEEISTRPTTTP